VILVSHNLTAIQSLCTSCLLLHKGRLLMQDTPDRCARAYIDMNAPEVPEASRTFTPPDHANIWLERVTVLSDGVPSATPTMGQSLSLEVSFRSKVPTAHPRFGLILTTADGYPVLNTGGRYLPSPEFDPPVTQGTLRFHLGKVPLVGRRYYLSLYLGDQVDDRHVEENAMFIDVQEKDLYQMGRVPPASDSAMFWPGTFERVS
jgi:hypothetical protein